MYVFKAIKSPESSIEKFESAIHCSRNCIESVLDCESLHVNVVEDTVVVDTFDQELSIDMTLEECQEKIKGCFCDDSGNLYDEFTKIISQYK